MSEQRAAPAPVRGLRLLGGGTGTGGSAAMSAAPGTGTGAGTVPGSVPPPVPGSGVVPMTVPERAGTVVRHCAGKASAAVHELWLHPERPVHVLWHGKPGSFAEHFSYVVSRAWVPQELTGRKAGFIAWAGFLYHVLIAWPLKAAAKVIDAAADRPLRLLGLVAFIVLLCLFLPI
jgi:hypothetical protein